MSNQFKYLIAKSLESFENIVSNSILIVGFRTCEKFTSRIFSPDGSKSFVHKLFNVDVVETTHNKKKIGMTCLQIHIGSVSVGKHGFYGVFG